jgi:SAM-dependent methyltransferase
LRFAALFDLAVRASAAAALLPVLKANPTCRATACDISPTALRLLRRAAQQAGVAPERIRTVVLDAAAVSDGAGQQLHGSGASLEESGCHRDAPASPLAGLGADTLLLVFTLSALPPEAHANALAHAFAALRPGGLLLFRCMRWHRMPRSACQRRSCNMTCTPAKQCGVIMPRSQFSVTLRCRDYGLYDMAQLRFPGEQMLGENLYRRRYGTYQSRCRPASAGPCRPHDVLHALGCVLSGYLNLIVLECARSAPCSEGTLAYFFSVEGLRAAMAAAGFEEVDDQYACVQVTGPRRFQVAWDGTLL